MSYTSKDLNYPNEFHFKKIIGPTNLIFEKASNLDDADYRSICWIKNKGIILNALEKTKAKIIVIPSDTDTNKLSKSKCFILSEDPKLTFSKICNKLFVEPPPPSIHESTVIAEGAEIKNRVSLDLIA